MGKEISIVDLKVQCPECGFREWVPEEKDVMKAHISEYGVLNPTAETLKACPKCGTIDWHKIERIVERGVSE